MSIDTIYKVTLHPFINESIASLKSMTNLSGSSSETFMDKVEDFPTGGEGYMSRIQDKEEFYNLMQ